MTSHLCFFVLYIAVKDVNQSLVDDNLISSDKIGAGNFYWCFPSKTYTDLNAKKTVLTEMSVNITTSINGKKLQLQEIKLSRNANNRDDLIQQLNELKSRNIQLDYKLEALKHNDPVEIKKIENEAKLAKLSSDRWTDNIFSIKSYMMKKKGLAGKEMNTYLGIDENFDYVNPPKIKNK